MKRVVVVGSGGAGKSTYSRRLGEVTGLPVVHLDRLYWRAGWIKTPSIEWVETVRRETGKPEWIMDGNFGGTREMRMLAADTIVFLDISRWRCLFRVLKRAILYRDRTRPDMAPGCHERFDMEFILWVWNYPRRSRKNLIDELSRLGEQEIVILKTNSQIEGHLKSIATQGHDN